MRYRSTRSGSPSVGFVEATLSGLAPDGGLYLPEHWPRFSPSDWAGLQGLGYAEAAVRIMAPYVDGLEPRVFAGLVHEAYAGFCHAAVAPLVQLDERHFLLELHHGPTLAFKDIALQLLGRLFERLLADRGGTMTILGATSGDTGSAAIEAVANRPGIAIVMLHPRGRVTEVQRRQMTTLQASNVHNIAIDGSFDDCQALVKTLLADPQLRRDLGLSAVNSINWARLMAQIVYYATAAVALGAPHRPIAFSVPTGNFGDVFAGHCARLMGLPVAGLIVATNENDVLARAFASGDYSRRAVEATPTPSMDIQISSNFERLLALMDNDPAITAERMKSFETKGAMQLEPALVARLAREGWRAERIDQDAMHATLHWAWTAAGQLIDPHTAVGLAAARRAAPLLDPATPIVTLATAHPAKFRNAVERAVGVRPGLPARVAGLFDRAERCEEMAADAEAIRRFLVDRAAPTSRAA